jgi:hypothetical protein
MTSDIGGSGSGSESDQEKGTMEKDAEPDKETFRSKTFVSAFENG